MKDALTFIDGPLAFTLAPLVACSVAALALIADALIRMATTRKIRGRIGGQVEAALEAGDPRAALDVLISGRPFFTGAANALKAMAGEPKALRDEAASLALAEDVRALTRPRSGLVTLAALAPTLGPLGPVTGLMAAFRALEAYSGPVEPSVVAGGLWQAMVTTGVGLAVAVPCVLVAAAVKSWADDKAARAGAVLTRISIALESTRGGDPSP